MFWSTDELEELKGTSVVGLSFPEYIPLPRMNLNLDKIGREDAERNYYRKLLPAIQVCATPLPFLKRRSHARPELPRSIFPKLNS